MEQIMENHGTSSKKQKEIMEQLRDASKSYRRSWRIMEQLGEQEKSRNKEELMESHGTYHGESWNTFG
jgi:hypothetical protein